MKFLLEVCKGILIGAGSILPGISSGVLCVVFGIYEKILDSVLNLFKDFRNNFRFLFPLGIGGIIGIIIFSRILEYMLYSFPLQTKSMFIGLILGGIWLLFKEMNEKKQSKRKNFIFLILSFIIGIIMVLCENQIQISVVDNVNYMYLFICGFLMSIGIVVPGVSSTIILMLLGVYSIYLNSISTLYFPILIPIALGILTGSIIFMKLIKYLLDKFYSQTMFSIIGFSLGSILILLPTFQSFAQVIICGASILSGFFVINLLKTQ